MDPNYYRQALREEISSHTGYSVASLQRFDDQDLVYLALKRERNNTFDEPPEELARLRFHIMPDMTDVLRAGRWRTQDQLASMPAGEKRQALINELNRISLLPKDVLNALNDYDLSGRGVATAFLLQMRLRTEADLHVATDLEGYRNTLVVEVAGRCGYDGGYLQGLDNQQLVRLALEPKPTNHFASINAFPDLRNRLCPSRPVHEQQGIIAAAAEMANYSDAWRSIGDRLDWLTQLLYPATLSYTQEPQKEHPEKELAKAIRSSAWSAFTSHACNLDYYGKSPRWIPKLSLGTYLEAFKSSVDLLKNTEKDYKKYFAAWNDQKTATTHLQNVLASTDATQNSCPRGSSRPGGRRARLRTVLRATTMTEGIFCDSLKKGLQEFEAEVMKAFGLNAEPSSIV